MKTALVQLLLYLTLLFIPTIGWSSDRLNILIIVGDDWGPDASAYAGVYGRKLPSSVVKTPNIDRIAHNGVLFKNAYVNAPTCTASRSSIFSGRYFFNTGGGSSLGGLWDSTIPTFPLLLRDAGYHIGYTYKGWAPGRPVDAPLGGLAYAYNKSGFLPLKFGSHASDLIAKGWSFEQAKQRILKDVRGNFESFLAARKPNQPFLYWFGPSNIHRPYRQGSGKTLWGINPENLKGKLPIFIPDVPEVRESIADYLGEIQAFDAYVGVLLKKLEDIGELDNTLIVVTGDNGPSGIPHGKFTLYDSGVSTPLVIWLPHSKGGRVVTDFTTLMDLAPTFLQVAGVPNPPKINGRSLLNILKSSNSGQIDAKRTFAITGTERHSIYAHENNLGYPARALRTADFLYIRNFAPDRWPMGCPFVTWPGKPSAFRDWGPKSTNWLMRHRNTPYFIWAFGKHPEEQLYDIDKDPGQIINVATNPAYATIKAQLAEKLLTELKKAGDPRVTGDGTAFDRPPYTNPVPVACQDTIPLNY